MMGERCASRDHIEYDIPDRDSVALRERRRSVGALPCGAKCLLGVPAVALLH
jgi:hypothetical protein